MDMHGESVNFEDKRVLNLMCHSRCGRLVLRVDVTALPGERAPSRLLMMFLGPRDVRRVEKRLAWALARAAVARLLPQSAAVLPDTWPQGLQHEDVKVFRTPGSDWVASVHGPDPGTSLAARLRDYGYLYEVLAAEPERGATTAGRSPNDAAATSPRDQGGLPKPTLKRWATVFEGLGWRQEYEGELLMGAVRTRVVTYVWTEETTQLFGQVFTRGSTPCAVRLRALTPSTLDEDNRTKVRARMNEALAALLPGAAKVIGRVPEAISSGRGRIRMTTEEGWSVIVSPRPTAWRDTASREADMYSQLSLMVSRSEPW
ncbi:MAG: hypothetical protein ACYTFI_09845 [Planctomycetota bacterium]